jgi:hypothetical protein
MSISSLSLSLVNRAAPTPAAPAGAQLAPASAPVPAPLPVADEKHGGARPKALYNAILSALRDLGMTAAPPAPVGTAASADAPPAAAATPSVKAAVSEFTSALFQALGGAGESVGGEEHHPNHGRGHAYAYGRTSHAWSRDGYAGLADRLEGLAASLASPATPAAPAPPTAPIAETTAPTVPTAPTAPTAPSVLSAQVAPEAPATAPAAESPATPATTPVTASTGRAPEPTPIDAPVSNPLVNAFDSLLQTLRVPVAAGSSGSDVVARLASFLHSLAQALQPTPAEQVAPATGMLLDETA